MEFRTYLFLFSIPLFYTTDVIALNIVTIVLGGNAAYEYSLSGPTYDVAFQEATKKYPYLFLNVSRHLIFQSGISKTCDDEAALIYNFSGEIFNRLLKLSGPTLIQNPGCIDVAITLGDFSRELDMPLIVSSSGLPIFLDKKRFPTLLAFSPVDHGSLVTGAKMFMAMFEWKTITLLCGLDYQAATSFEIGTCKNLETSLRRQPGVYDINLIPFDPEKIENYESILLRIKTLSRIIFVSTNRMFLRMIMLCAANLNMTTGDYLFFSPQSNTFKDQLLRPWNKNDTNDPIALRAFRSLILYVSKGPNWDSLSKSIEKINNGSVTALKRTQVPVNTLNIAAYEGFSCFAEVWNETSLDFEQKKELTGKQMAKKFWNRTFSLPSAAIYVNNAGFREVDVVFLRFSNDTMNFEEAWVFNASTKTLKKTTELADQWALDTGPPLDRPKCGFSNEKCFEIPDKTVIIAASVVTATTLLIIGITTGFCVCWTRKLKIRNSLWWYIDPINLSSVLASSVDMEEIAAGTLDSRSSIIYSHRLMLFQNKFVMLDRYKVSVKPGSIAGRKIVSFMLAIKHLSHINIGIFYGMSLTEYQAFTVWEFGAKGSLRTLLDSEEIQIDKPIRLSFCWDVLEGLAFIQNSNVQFHGSLSSLTCMIDKRLSVQLVSIGSKRIFKDTEIAAKSYDGNNTVGDGLADFWLAPEMLLDRALVGSKAADVFSLAVIFGEILTGQTPLGVQLYSINSVEENLIMVNLPRSTTNHAWLTRIDVNKPDVPVELRHIIHSCFSDLPNKRPSIRYISEEFRHSFRRKGAVESLVKRLESYAEDLEDRVTERTEELLTERSKVDILLGLIIPPTFVIILRNKQIVEAEFFESVTLFFSELPEFAEICVACAPFEIFRFLSIICSAFDLITEKYDVYKVETIKDSYMVASGLPMRNGPSHSRQIAFMALEFINCSGCITSSLDSTKFVQLQIGIHSGPCAAGIVGSRMPRYCLFGDTVNTASRMQSHGKPNRIHTSQSTKNLLENVDRISFQSRGLIDIKGKGTIETFWLTERKLSTD